MTPRKDLLDIQSLTDEELDFILTNAVPFKNLFKRSVKKVPTLRGRTVLTLFYEPSTRTRSSFEVAASRLSADVVNFSVSTSSVVKGESVLDTISTLEAMRTDYVVVRHSNSGIPNLIAKNTTASVINAGDGFHAHPTQALLDVFTLKEVFGGDVRGSRIAFIGDIQHSRVARSTNLLCRRMGMHTAMLAPSSLIPRELPKDIAVFGSWAELYAWKPDVIYLLRVQMERQNVPFFPSLGEYHRQFGMTDDRLARIRDAGVWVMHPGPVNRGVELTDNVMTYERCLIDQQVENGIAVRMSVLYWLKPGSVGEDVNP
ncbi:aspartate carbamoyltransferase catalytic subunit [Roseimicrobium sp. ORNL1]|uniref:aspartate carbamoyltransferase catalytic subunit n=1 Tax=Roseimicrobium sp. ORNL1 TaxID=2711231 RepID=UPI0013E145A4|nr:aspartate carbamoyltransferase catalytic subunit [Roseimicrobium sp. ORNL1]QIF01404.1 aspartate carbamoyltransferase catalytic subunit [Roseimicrobium sp. ORNL1]